MAKQFTTVRELTGEELKEKIGKGVDAVVEAVKDVIEEGGKYRISVRDKNGDIKVKTTANVGAAGLGLSMILVPVFTFLIGVTAFVAGVACDYKLVIEKVVEESADSESVKA